jgi:transposase
VPRDASVTPQERGRCHANVKQLEAGTFAFPVAEGQPARVTLRAAELAMLLDGVDWQNVRRRRRYRRPAPA